MVSKLVAVVLAFVVALTACGDSGGGSGDGQPEFGSDEFGLTSEELNGKIEATEASVAACMDEEGFEYVAVDPVTVREAMDSDGSLPGVSDEDFVAQYGFGITTLPEDPLLDLGRGEQNTRIYEALSEADQVAYDRALLGEPGNMPLARALENEDFSETGGCVRAAAEENFEPAELAGTYVNPGDVLIEQDPRMVDALEAWAECVREAGYDYQHPDEITDELAERLAALLDGADPASLSGPAQAALTDLQGEELALADVSVTCEEEHILPVEEQIEEEIYGGDQP